MKSPVNSPDQILSPEGFQLRVDSFDNNVLSNLVVSWEFLE